MFTDLVGSTALRQRLGDRASAEVFAQHHDALRAVLTETGGEEIETAGDSLLVTFTLPSSAVRFALEGRQRVAALAGERLRDRFSIHLGEVVVRFDGTGGRKNLSSSQLDLGARVLGLADEDRILMTRAVFDSARQQLSRDDLIWSHHGRYILKGIEEPVEVCEVTDLGEPPTAPEGDAKGRRVEDDVVAGWRPGVGQTIPRTSFVLEARVGDGAVGEVWRARKPDMDEVRVFKFCFDADRLRSLRREVELFRLLRERVGNHPGIVSLRDINFEEPPYFIVTDWVAGRDLLQWWQARSEPPPLDQRLEIVAKIAIALQAAHDAGVVHRDVKPQNVLMREGSAGMEPMLADFGIGRAMDPGGAEGAGLHTILSERVTSSSGTLAYLPPETIAGKPATPRSDVFSLGVLLWQLVVGELTRPLPPDWSRSVEDPLLLEDLQRCLAGEPTERPSALELARSLRDLPERKAEHARAAADQAARERAAWRKGVAATVVGAGLVVAVMAVLAIAAWNEATRADAASAQAATAERTARIQAEQLATDVGMAQLAEGDPARSLGHFVKALQNAVGEPTRERLARIRLARAFAQSPRLVYAPAENAGMGGVAVSPDGARLVMYRPGKGIVLRDLKAGVTTVLNADDSPGVTYVAWHAVEPWIGVWNPKIAGGRGRVLVLDAVRATVLASADDSLSVTEPLFGWTFERDSFRVAVQDGAGTKECWTSIDATTAKVDGPHCGPLTRSAGEEVGFRMTPLGLDFNTLDARDKNPHLDGRTTGGVTGATSDQAVLLHYRPARAIYEMLRTVDGAPIAPPIPHEYGCAVSVDDALTAVAFRCPMFFMNTLGTMDINSGWTIVQIWRVPPVGRGFRSLPTGAVFAVSPSRDRGVVVNTTGTQIVDLVTGRKLLKTAMAPHRVVRTSPSLRYFCDASIAPAALVNDALEVWRLRDANTGAVVREVTGVNGGPRCAWTSDSSKVAVPVPKSVEVFAADGTPLRSIAIERPLFVAWLPEGALAVATADTLLVTDPQGKVTSRVPVAHSGIVAAATSATLLTYSHEASRIWSVDQNGALQALATIPTPYLLAAAFDATAKRIVTLTRSGLVQVWDVATGAALTPPATVAPNPAVPRVGFSSNGMLVHAWFIDSDAVEAGGNLATWDAATATPLGMERGPWVVGPAEQADGTLQVEGYATPDPRPVEDWVAIAELHSGRRLTDGSRLTLQELEARWRRLADAYPADFR